MWLKFNGKLNESFLFKKCLELISTAIPPELPAALIIGLSLAMSKLKAHNVFCPDPYSVLQAGGVSTVIFDKTGTLTESTMQFVKPLGKNLEQVQMCMAVCHALLLQDGKVVGDDLDLGMFAYTAAKMAEKAIILQSGEKV